MITDRRSLVERVSDTLMEEMARGQWKEWLPQERSLAQSLGISRNTLRAALVRLRKQGLVEPIRGQGYRVVKKAGAKPKKTTPKSNTVVILSPEPLDWLRPTLGVLIDELRVFLFKAGLTLEVHNGKHYYRSGSPQLLAKLVAQHPAICWILIRASERVQHWFDDQKIPCLISGSAFPGVKLPSLDVDQYAVGAHAAGRLLGLGHRHLLLVLEGYTAGMNACERGFCGVVEKSSGATVSTLYHSPNIQEIRQLLVKTMSKKQRPTGILVTNSYYYLTVSGILHQMGLRVPEDVSLMCTDSDHFLPFMVPEASHYDFSHETFARKLSQKVKKIVHGQPLQQRETRIFPSFVPGASIAPPPKNLK